MNTKHSISHAILPAATGGLIRLVAYVFTFLFWFCIILLVLFFLLFYPNLPLLHYIQKSVLILSVIGISFFSLIYPSFRLIEWLCCLFINSYVDTHTKL